MGRALLLPHGPNWVSLGRCRGTKPKTRERFRSASGHSRRSDRPPVTSGLPPIADIPSTVPLRALSLIGALSYARSSNRDSNLERIWFQVVPLALYFSKLY